MQEIEKIQEELKSKLSEKRYLHSLGTMKMAKKLAEKYSIDSEKAVLVGLTHDIGKEIPDDEKLEYVKQNKIEIDEIEQKNVGLLHAKIGAHITKEKYNFTQDMQKAIEYHTTAHPEMDLLAKIIFIADKVEETRDYSDIETVRNLAMENIDECMLYILNYAIKKNIDKGKLVHINSIITRNKLIMDTSK